MRANHMLETHLSNAGLQICRATLIIDVHSAREFLDRVCDSSSFKLAAAQLARFSFKCSSSLRTETEGLTEVELVPSNAYAFLMNFSFRKRTIFTKSFSLPIGAFILEHLASTPRLN